MSVSASASVNTNEKPVKISFEKHLQIITEATGVPAKPALIVLGVLSVFVLIGYLDVYITNIVGIVFPTYWSIKAIESAEADDDKQWLTYWIVFALFSLTDLFSGFILRFIPFYFFFKLIFLIVLMAPNIRGATIVYDNVIRKIFLKYEKDLDNLTSKITKTSENAADLTRTYIKENKASIISGGLNLTHKIVETTTVEKKET
jgi:receptor expression-enhancing protein 5/6